MTKFYQVVNFQHDQVSVWKTQSEAIDRMNQLYAEFPNEGFYVVELIVVSIKGAIN